MQATELKAEVQSREAIVLPPAPAAEPPAVPAPETTQDSPGATKEDSCCAVPAGRAGRWRSWLIGGAVIVPIALYGGWDWLVATGAAAVLIGILPCVAMCALGLCMGRGKSKGAMTLADIRKTYEADSAEPPKRS